MTRDEMDDEKVCRALNVSHPTNIPNFRSWRSDTVVEIRDEFRWTLSRTQRAFDRLLASGRIKQVGISLGSLSVGMGWEPLTNRKGVPIYALAREEVAS